VLKYCCRMASVVAEPTGRPPTLVGRVRERAGLHAHVEAARRGAGGTLVLLGAPGAGKSLLAADAIDQAQRLGMTVLAGSCHPYEVDQPFAVFAGLFDRSMLDPTPSLGRSVLEAGAPSDPAIGIADRIVDLVEADVVCNPMLLVVDDAQWADAGTVRSLRLLATRVSALGLAMVVAARPPRPGTPFARALTDWSDGGTVQVMELGGLSEDEVGELAVTVLGAATGPTLARILAEAEGNPFLVVATLEAAQHRLQHRAGSVDVDPGTSLRPGSVVECRIDELELEVRRVVQLAAVLGNPCRVEVIAALRARPAIEVIDALDAAAAAGVMVYDDVAYRFRHDLVRDAALASLSSNARAALHREAASVLSEHGGHELEIAEHYLLGAQIGDRVAIGWLHETARKYCRRAPGTALRLVDAALALATDPEPDLLATRFEALAGSGRASEAEAIGRVLLHDISDPVARARLHRELALSMFVQGQAVRACDEMGAAVELLLGHDGQERAIAERSFAFLLALDLGQAATLAESARSSGRDANAQVAAEAVLTVSSLFAARFDDAGEHAARMLEHAERWRANESHQYQPWFCAGLLAAETDDLAGLERLARQGRDVAVRSGSAWAVPAYDGLCAFAALRSGQLADAEAFALAAIDYSDEVDSFGILVWCHSFLAQIALARGDLTAARQNTASAEAILASGRTGFGLDHIAMCRSYLHEADGDTEAALRSLEDIWTGFSLLSLATPRQWMGPRLTRLAMVHGRDELATEVVAALTETADRTGLATMRADALLARAWSAGEAGAALAAASVLESSPRRFQRAEALAAASMLAQRDGATAEGIDAALMASDLFESVGATALAEVAMQLAPTRGRRRIRPLTGVGALTKSELAIVSLVAEGLGNDAIAAQLHLSRRTVESHVSAAYRKLGVGTRVEMALAFRSGGADSS
jgi:DNA-binding NarL/FixJ family response regulator